MYLNIVKNLRRHSKTTKIGRDGWVVSQMSKYAYKVNELLFTLFVYKMDKKVNRFVFAVIECPLKKGLSKFDKVEEFSTSFMAGWK